MQPLLPSDNSGSLSSGMMRFQTAKVEVDQAGDEFVDVLPEEELEIGLAEAVTLTASDIGLESGQAVKSTTVEGIKVSKRELVVVVVSYDPQKIFRAN